MKKLAAVLAALLLVSTGSPVLARCDPGRATAAQTTNYGAKMITGGAARFRSITATVDNNDVPYIEGGGVTTTWLRLGHRSGDSNPNAIAMIGVRWSAGQGLLTSTQFRTYITNEEGTVVLVNGPNGTVGNTGGSDTALNLELIFEDAGPPIGGGEDAFEKYYFRVNGSPLITWQLEHGAQGFTTAEVYSQKDNQGSQVPGESSTPHRVWNIVYTSQFGVGQWGPTGGLINTGVHGNINAQAGFVYTYDVRC